MPEYAVREDLPPVDAVRADLVVELGLEGRESSVDDLEPMGRTADLLRDHVMTEGLVEEPGDVATVGITEYAQEQLGDVVFVELPEAGREVGKGDDMAVVESVKAASDIYAPVSGRIVAINEDLENDPALINADPYGDGWLFEVELNDTEELDGLKDAEAYEMGLD